VVSWICSDSWSGFKMYSSAFKNYNVSGIVSYGFMVH
jgi:hypothetical protein